MELENMVTISEIPMHSKPRRLINFWAPFGNDNDYVRGVDFGGKTFLLNKSAGQIWKLIDSQSTFEQIIEIAVKKFSLDRNEVIDFLKSATTKGWVSAKLAHTWD